MLQYDILCNSQNKSLYKYTNLKLKLLLCKNSISSNKSCLEESTIPEYAQPNTKTYSHNRVAYQQNKRPKF
jgi:hypothetical protein